MSHDDSLAAERAKLRNLAGVMLQHAVVAPWWRPDRKARALWSARSYARRSLGWPR